MHFAIAVSSPGFRHPKGEGAKGWPKMGGGSPPVLMACESFRYRLSLNGKIKRDNPAVLGAFDRRELDLQVGLCVDLRKRDIKRFKRSVAKENRLALCHNDLPDRQKKRVRPGPRRVSEILEVA
jgi:hypothetical protein